MEDYSEETPAPGRRGGRARGRSRWPATQQPNASITNDQGTGPGSDFFSSLASSTPTAGSSRSSDAASVSSRRLTESEYSESEKLDGELDTTISSRVSSDLRISSDDDAVSVATVVSSRSEGSVSNQVSESGRASVVTESGIVRTIRPGFNKIGVDGTPVDVTTNYYWMNKSPDFVLHQYRVDFTPVEDNTTIKKLLLRQHEKSLGAYIFDGSMLYKSQLIPSDYHKLQSRKTGGSLAYEITLRLVGQVNPEDSMFLQFYNIVMRKAMTLLGMEELGRNLYDRDQKIAFKEERLELWPGFITAIRNHLSGTLLCVEVTHKVLRTCTVYEVMKSLKKPGISVTDFEKAVRAELEDTIIMTHYNQRTYKVSNICFKTNPASSFRNQDGELCTYAEYYKSRYNLTIKPEEMNQPMLISQPKKRDINKGVTGDIYLVPSLCNPTGLNDTMRKNFQLMKKLSTHLHMSPMDRKNKLDEFMYKIKNTPAVQKEFAAWNVDFDPQPMSTQARILSKEKIILSPEDKPPVDVDDKGDWTRNLGRFDRKVLKPEHLRRWIVFAPRNDVQGATSFIKVLQRMGSELGIEVEPPVEIVSYDVARLDENLMKERIEPYERNLDLVFFVLPNNQLRRYAEVKHYCSLRLGVPSQCFLAKNLASRTLNSIASKVMIQVTAKMGGVPWSIKVPLKKLMVLGFDVYHCSNRKGESAGGLVATSSPSLTSYVSVVSFHKDKSELSSNMCVDMTTCLNEYRKSNGFLPDRIVMYRDGVGEGQVQYVLSHEVEQMKLAIRDTYSNFGEPVPKLTFIIVTKKINSRAFLRTRNGYGNLPVGTVMDNDITLPERYDFFMVSQDVRQGTVSPTNYNVVHDESDMSADKMQRLSYKLCHLYFNWSGTVAVPAPCQYAHKLAYLTGVAVNEKVQARLNTKLWYL